MNIGIDLVHIPSFQRQLQNSAFLERAFLPSERTRRDPAHLAGIFAAKEAYMKACGEKKEWLSLEIAADASGKPIISELPHNPHIASVSITHEHEYAAAVVIIFSKHTA